MKKAIIFLGLIMLLCLLGAAACSTGTAAKSKTTLTPAEQEELDPEFWRMWGHLHGLGN
jgi:ABC-type glycerol-3-phosphate transport system substrate-binding protein